MSASGRSLVPANGRSRAVQYRSQRQTRSISRLRHALPASPDKSWRQRAENLRSAFGHVQVAALRRCDAYRYLDQSLLAKRHRAAKANKEISLMHTILEYGVRLGMLDANPFDGVTR